MKLKKTFIHLLPMLASLYLLVGCSGQKATGNNDQQADSTTDQTIEAQFANIFNADSAYQYIARQVAFGPRVPGTEAHAQCADWIVQTMKSFGHDVQIQEAKLKVYDGTEFTAKNIITTINPTAQNRVLLLAHWDSRPHADHDPNPANHNTPILAADDGGSGVGVLLEIARQLQKQPLDYGVDIIFFDLEDYGVTEKDDSWCLGSEYWSKNPHYDANKPLFGILLDMVGAKDARFYWEGYSKAYASAQMNQIWQTAANLGFGKFFKQADGGAITDDHVPIIKNLQIPVVDIINYDPNTPKGFAAHWHTKNDNMDIISTETLTAVGATVMTVLTNYKPV